jgi:hypothetical protein
VSPSSARTCSQTASASGRSLRTCWSFASNRWSARSCKSDVQTATRRRLQSGSNLES